MSNAEEVRCKKCRRPFKEHSEDDFKCLFDATTFDGQEELRMALVKDINAVPLEREALEKKWGEVWDTKQVQEAFVIYRFLAPFAYVRRKKDGLTGALAFQHLPRFYYDFLPDCP